MVRMFKPFALVGAALLVSSVPALAQGTGPLGLDMDPFHLFTPAAAPEPAPMMKRHAMRHHHKMMMKKKMMKKEM